jgi:hypothetical protein
MRKLLRDTPVHALSPGNTPLCGDAGAGQQVAGDAGQVTCRACRAELAMKAASHPDGGGCGNPWCPVWH